MRALFLLTAVSLPLFLNSCALINSAIKDLMPLQPWAMLKGFQSPCTGRMVVP